MRKIIVALLALTPTTALADASLDAFAAASKKALAVNWQCAKAIGIPALYEAQKTITVSDMQLAGMPRDDAIIFVHDGAPKIESVRQADESQSAVCSKLIDDAREELNYARAKFRKSRGLN